MLCRIEQLMNSSGVCFGTSGARGLVVQMTDQVCYAYVSAFLKAVVPKAERVVVGHDLRPSSPAIAAACAQAASDAGVKVVYAGKLPTPALAFYANQIGAPAIVVTGSHIPFDRNGIKFYRTDGEISKADEQAIKASVIDVPEKLRPDLLGSPKAAAEESYLNRYLNFFEPGSLSGMTIALYEHSSVARDLLQKLLMALGAKVIALGRADIFVPIDTEAVRPEDIEIAHRWAMEYQFDALLSTDGDADRPLIANERGEWLRGDLVGLLCAKYLDAGVVVTPVSSNTAVEKCGFFKNVIRTRIGSPYVIAGIETALGSADRVVGYEANGGFLLGSTITSKNRVLEALPTRDAVLPMLAILSMSREKGCKVSEIARALPARYTASDRLQDFSLERGLSLIRGMMEDHEMAAGYMAPDSGSVISVDITDGLRVLFENGEIVHLRQSGNAPELRCYAESDTPERAIKLSQQCLRTLDGAKGF